MEQEALEQEKEALRQKQKKWKEFQELLARLKQEAAEDDKRRKELGIEEVADEDVEEIVEYVEEVVETKEEVIKE